MPGKAGRNRRKTPSYYWNNIAPTKTEAQALAARLNLDFPTPDDDPPVNSNISMGQSANFKNNIVYPIRRLIITGEDTPTNLDMLLGPLWESKEGVLIQKTRIEVLLRPPPGSPAHGVFRHLDEGCPPWTPREPDEKEQNEMDKVQEVKGLIAQQIGDRKDVTTEDTRQIIQQFGSNWVEQLPMLEVAMNNTDQGVRM